MLPLFRPGHYCKGTESACGDQGPANLRAVRAHKSIRCCWRLRPDTARDEGYQTSVSVARQSTHQPQVTGLL